MSHDLQVLMADVERLERELQAAEKRVNDARDTTAPFKVGDVVEANQYNKGWKLAIVRRVKHWSYSTDFYVSFAKKDGEWGTVERYVGSNVRTPEPAA